MDLFVVIDRGDVWYDFPYDEKAASAPQPVARRPRLTIFTRYLGQNIPLARFGTTIGGWRTEYIDGVMWWKYKESPVGQRVWTADRRVAGVAPARQRRRRAICSSSGNVAGRASPKYEVDYHETGPGYASAYGLVAAYHLKFTRNADGTLNSTATRASARTAPSTT